MRLGHLPRVGLSAVFRPAQLPQPGAGVTGADGRTARVTLPQAALTRLAGSAFGAGERAG